MTPEIPKWLWIKWGLQALAQIPLRIVVYLVAPIAVATMDNKKYVQPWAWWLAPVDHALSGIPMKGADPKTHADPMWWRWWHTDDGSRAWYCTALKKLGIRDTEHWIVRLLQLWRNGGAGVNYTWFGVDLTGLEIIKHETEDGNRYFAYKADHVISHGGIRQPFTGSLPRAFYITGDGKRGWKLNYIIEFRGAMRCKWIWRI